MKLYYEDLPKKPKKEIVVTESANTIIHLVLAVACVVVVLLLAVYLLYPAIMALSVFTVELGTYIGSKL